ncbi:hypothetical protein Tco_0982394 [Tanacetum coccineum]
MTSQSASQQTVIPHDELLPRDQFLPIKENNFIFCPDAICTKCPVMVEILKGHPIFKALTLSEDVPEIYVQQFWNTIAYNTTVPPHKFEGMIEDVHVAFTLKQFRRMFDLTGKEEYDDFSPEEELCADIVRLGYEESLPKASAFRRKHLSQVWATLFSIINRCLTSKSTGMDQCSISVLRIFQGIAFNKNYDYARLFWNDLMEVVKDKNLPSKARKFVPFLRFLKIIIFSMMRRYKDIPRRPNDPTIVDFQMKYLRRDCGNSNVQEMRIPDELLAYADQSALCVIEYRNSSPLMIEPEPKGSTMGAPGATLGSNSDPKRTQGDNIQLYSRRKKSDDIQSYNDSDDADNQDSRLNITNIANEDSNNEGGVANEERSSEESENLLQTKSDNWVNTSTKGLHLLISSIEQDFMDPVTQALTPPSHSVSSQQGPVSIARRELANNLLHSHSEDVNIEKGGHLLSSPASLSAQSSLEPSKTMSKTLELNASLCNFAGTSVVVPNVGISRGSEGNPTSFNITPTQNVGHPVESTVVATEPLSGPGVSNFPEFVSREYLDGALKAVQESFDKKLADMQRLLNEKHVATEEAILPPPPPPRSQQDLSVDELKQLLLTKLLSQSEDESADADLIMILRKQSEVSQNSATKEDAMNPTRSVNATLEKLSARVAALEQSLKSQAHGLKRRHDDPNEAGDNVMEPMTAKKRLHQQHNSNGS